MILFEYTYMIVFRLHVNNLLYFLLFESFVKNKRKYQENRCRNEIQAISNNSENGLLN